MEDTFLQKHLESSLVPPSQHSGQFYLQLWWKNLQASLVESPAGELRKDILPTHQTWGEPGFPISLGPAKF